MLKNQMSNNPKMLKTARLYNILAKAEREEILENYLKGKKIAVVGNGPYEIGKNKGQEIDSHDVVYRFNNYATDEKFKCDYGSKITVWSMSCLHDFTDINERDISNLKIILIGVPYTRRKFSESFVDKVLELHDSLGIGLVPVNSKYYAEIADLSNINFLTGGFSALKYALNVCGRENVDAYGFSFLDDEACTVDTGLSRYFEERDIEKVYSWHNFVRESEILREDYKILK